MKKWYQYEYTEGDEKFYIIGGLYLLFALYAVLMFLIFN